MEYWVEKALKISDEMDWKKYIKYLLDKIGHSNVLC